MLITLLKRLIKSKKRQSLITFLLLGFCSFSVWAQERPNILLIVADDLGYGDLGVYGGDIRTPNIDELAKTGKLFSQFHTAPVCALTRAMLLTGNNNHVAGLGFQGSKPGPVIPGLAGYENSLSDRVAPFPQLLQEVGYRTYIAGKWHLGEIPGHLPKTAGFSRSFVLASGSGNHFNDVGIRESRSSYWEGDEQVDWPVGGYSTEVYTDKLLGYLEADKDSDKPFFMMAAYTSPHWPLQVPDDELDLYSGKYDMGYDILREQRFESLKNAKIIPPDSQIPPRSEAVTPWTDLTPEQQRRESRKMEIYAAMVENLDTHVGRLIAYLHENKLFENTLIMFMSDNGPAAENFYEMSGFDYIRSNYDTVYENMGKPSSWVAYGRPWAEAGSAPFNLFKGFTTEGGIVAPMIVSGPGVNGAPQITDTYMTVSDLAPTFLDITGGSYPGDKVPMVGESARSFFEGSTEQIHDEDYTTVLWLWQRAYVRQGNWKIVSIARPFDEGNFKLYNVNEDPGETTDLSQMNPEKRDAMISLWRNKRKEYGIILPEDL